MRGSWPAAAVAAIVIAALGFPGHAVVGEVGHDVSWPQCNDRVPAGAFTIVGVTKALPYQMNPCLVPQVRAAKAFGPVQLYVNTANRGPASPYWSKPGRTTPVPCRNVKSNDDAGCAYNYGWDAAADAFKGARSSLAGVLDVRTVTWWLDVEGSRTPGVDGNSWRGSASANAADLQGFMDFLRSAGVREVGIYSTPLQWSDITGGYHRSSAKNLRARWGFRVRYPLEDAPVWFGGVGDVTDGRRRCKVRSFTGGERLFAQFHDGAYDGNVRCAHPDRRRPTAALVTPHAAVTSASTVNVTWRATDRGGAGLASYDIRYRRALRGQSMGTWRTPAAWHRVLGRSTVLAGLRTGGKYCFSVRARDAAGNVSAWTSAGCVRRS